MSEHMSQDAGALAATRPHPTHARLVVATAGEPASDGALALAAALTERDDAQVMALGVALPFPHHLSDVLSPKAPARLDDDARQRLVAQLRRSLDSVVASDRWTKQVLVGLPAAAINATASTWRASMILLGIGRHNRMDRVFGTETAIAVMREARVAVLAVPPAVRVLPSHALVAVDFTPASIAAAATAADLIANDGVVILAHVCAFADVPHRAGDLADVYRAGARVKLDQVAGDIRQRFGRRVESVMLEGEPARALLTYARTEHCDLISLGGHEQGLADRILLGSVRTRVLRGARCSVLIAPPHAAE